MPVFFVQYRLKTCLLYGIVGRLHLRGYNVRPFISILSKIFVFQRFRIVGFLTVFLWPMDRSLGSF